MANKIPEKTRQKVYERADYRCEKCNGNNGLQIHHIVKRRHRNHDIENLILLCVNCHRYVEDTRNGQKLNRKWKVELQKKYEQQGLSREEIKSKMGNRFYPEEAVTNNCGGFSNKECN